MAANRRVGGTGGGYMEQLEGGYQSWKSSENTTPPVLLTLVPTHTSTHTHLGTDTAKRDHSKWGSARYHFEYGMQCTKSKAQIRQPAL